MLAETLALALALASSGTPRARPEAELSPENAARARRGLLPRKATRARPPPRGRRIVLLPSAPVWLGEPGELAASAGDAEARLEPASDVLAPAVEAVAGLPLAGAGRWVAVEGAEVEAVVLRRATRAGPAPLRAAVEQAEVEVVLRRRPRGGR